MLVPVPRSQSLTRGETRERSQVYVIVLPDDVRPVVMGHVVVHAPQPGTGSEQVCRIRYDVVDASEAGEGSVVGVMHNPSSRRQHGMDETNCRQHPQRPVYIQ